MVCSDRNTQHEGLKVGCSDTLYKVIIKWLIHDRCSAEFHICKLLTGASSILKQCLRPWKVGSKASQKTLLLRQRSHEDYIQDALAGRPFFCLFFGLVVTNGQRIRAWGRAWRIAPPAGGALRCVTQSRNPAAGRTWSWPGFLREDGGITAKGPNQNIFFSKHPKEKLPILKAVHMHDPEGLQTAALKMCWFIFVSILLYSKYLFHI